MRIEIASVGEPVLRNAARSLCPEEIGTDRIREVSRASAPLNQPRAFPKSHGIVRTPRKRVLVQVT
jgi:hypothetical protein